MPNLKKCYSGDAGRKLVLDLILVLVLVLLLSFLDPLKAGNSEKETTGSVTTGTDAKDGLHYYPR